MVRAYIDKLIVITKHDFCRPPEGSIKRFKESHIGRIKGKREKKLQMHKN